MDQSSVLQVVDDAVVTTVRETVPEDVLAQSVTELSSPKDQGAKGSKYACILLDLSRSMLRDAVCVFV